MGLSIRTNIASQTAFDNVRRIDKKSILSVEKLSSGLRINTAADDSAGMMIADSLNTQALGFGQASRNANDAISIVQIADAALAESQNIVNAIKVKSIQAAQDGQTLESRKAIQSDIDMLIKEFDQIAKNTSFNGQKLLFGNFTDKLFQIGAGSGQTLKLSIDSVVSGKIGHLSTGSLEIKDQEQGTAHIGIMEADSDNLIEIEPVKLAYDNRRAHGLGALAGSINRISDRTGVTASVSVVSMTRFPIKHGVTDSSFSINDVRIGRIRVEDNDEDGSLVKAINDKSLLTGIKAYVNDAGRLVLSSEDGRAIKVDSGTNDSIGTGISHVLSGEELTTFGHINLSGRGSETIRVYDLGGGAPVSVADTELNIRKTAHIDRESFLSAGSVLTAGTFLKYPWTADHNLSGTGFADAVEIDQQTTLKAGSSLGIGSVLFTKDVLPDTIKVDSDGVTRSESTIKKGSVLKKNSVLAEGTVLPEGNIVSAGTIFKGDAFIAATDDTTDMSIIKKDSELETGSVLASGTVLKGTACVDTAGPMAGNGLLKAGSTLAVNSILYSGTVIKGDATIDTINDTTGLYFFSAGSSLAANSKIASGTTIGGDAYVNQIAGTHGDYILAVNSRLNTNSVISSGTVLTGTAIVNAVNNTTDDYILTAGSTLAAGSVIGAGTTLSDNAVVNAINNTTGDYILAAGSSLAAGSVIGDGTTLSDSAVVNTINNTTGDYTIADGSSLAAGSVLGDGTTLKGDATINKVSATGNAGDQVSLASGSVLTAGTVIENGFTLHTTSGDITGPATTGSDVTTIGTNDFPVESGSIAAGSIIKSGSIAGPPGLSLSVSMNVSGDMTLKSGSTIAGTSTLAKNSVIGPDKAILASVLNLTGTMTLKSGSDIAGTSVLAKDSIIGPDKATLSTVMLITRAMTLKSGSSIAFSSALAQGSVVGADGINLASDMYLTAGAMTLKPGSTIASSSRLDNGSLIGADDAVLNFMMNITSPMVLQIHSDIAAGSVLATDSVVGADNAKLVADFDLNADMTLVSGSTIGNSSVLAVDSVLYDDKLSLVSGMNIIEDMNLTTGSSLGYGSSIKYGSKIWADATLISTMKLKESVTLASDMPLATDIVLGPGSGIGNGSTLVTGSQIYLKLKLLSKMNTDSDLLLDTGSEIADNNGSMISEGTRVGGDASLIKPIVLEHDFYISEDSFLGAGSVLKNGSDIGGKIETAFAETIGADGMSIKKGSVLAKGSVLGAGTFLTDDMLAIDGTIYPKGIFLKTDITIDRNVIFQEITLARGSEIAAGSILNANSDKQYASTSVSNVEISRLSNISVLSNDDAQRAIGISESAIKDIDRIRSNLGSVQNQLMSAITVISAIRTNLFSSESYIRDVDFANEADNLSRIKVLAEAGRFALSKANTRASELLNLFKPYDQK